MLCPSFFHPLFGLLHGSSERLQEDPLGNIATVLGGKGVTVVLEGEFVVTQTRVEFAQVEKYSDEYRDSLKTVLFCNTSDLET